jgi:hypothetical protein
MKALELWQTYSREDVHDIFSPDTAFTPQSGTWGLRGIIRLPERAKSFVFFVTFGRVQGEHAFDESVTEDGVLSWQSEPQQRLHYPTIKALIDHDDQSESIYLFLRTDDRSRYTYMGTLGYLTHDADREQPVHFQWQLLDWPAPEQTISDIGLPLLPRAGADEFGGATTTVPLPATYELIESPPPAGTAPGPTKTGQFKAVKMALHPDQDARNKKLGQAGEELVLEAERRRLEQAGRPDLAAQIVHVSAVEGDGAGYDIRSFDLNGSVRHLEVKTTSNGASSAFFVSPNEIAFSEAHPDSFELVRVFDYDTQKKSGSCYRVLGALSQTFNLTPSQFRASFAG